MILMSATKTNVTKYNATLDHIRAMSRAHRGQSSHAMNRLNTANVAKKLYVAVKRSITITMFNLFQFQVFDSGIDNIKIWLISLSPKGDGWSIC